MIMCDKCKKMVDTLNKSSLDMETYIKRIDSQDIHYDLCSTCYSDLFKIITKFKSNEEPNNNVNPIITIKRVKW